MIVMLLKATEMAFVCANAAGATATAGDREGSLTKKLAAARQV